MLLLFYICDMNIKAKRYMDDKKIVIAHLLGVSFRNLGVVYGMSGTAIFKRYKLFIKGCPEEYNYYLNMEKSELASLPIMMADNISDEEKYNLLRSNKKTTEDIIKKTYTYLMKDRSIGLYKIGKSINPKHRERTLQSEKPSIEMVKVWDKDIEKYLHNMFCNQRLRGEWFDLTPIQVRYICTHY